MNHEPGRGALAVSSFYICKYISAGFCHTETWGWAQGCCAWNLICDAWRSKGAWPPPRPRRCLLFKTTYLQKFMIFCSGSLYFQGCLPPFSGPVIWEGFFSRQLGMPLRGGCIPVCCQIIDHNLFTVLSAFRFFPREHLSLNRCIVELHLKGFHGQCALFHSHFASWIVT